MPPLPQISREIRLTTVPDGLPKPEHFVIADVPLPVPDDGQVLVRNRFFHVFAALRTLIGGSVEGAPIPPLRPGDTLFGPAIGEVVAASGDSGLRAGDLVSHWLGWREYAVVPVGQVTPLGDALPDPVAHLGQGELAYAALTRDAAVRPGDTVFVSGAAGGVGSLAGQIARLLGAGRVIGSTGSREKADRLISELGYDAAVIRGAAPIEEQLAKAAPDGIDVYLDNVGGDQLQAAVATARPGARFVLVGALSGQMSPHGTGGTAPVELDTYRLILKRISMRAFQGLDEQARSQWLERFGGWLRAGDITFPHVRVAGIDCAPRALQEMIEGRHFGTVIVEL
ncbi:NADP-dependent oxidoreductase [Streptosporangium sp. 'caverna']|uniref:MDR family NADP-dependent oxidoreductase n=1 Tax=Streptosporangium sp. 'caverna' TaxID=2202249 RepID=UPI000D7E0302|nr:NADP-dependent oxidoreductase [Streptosporangium sp. 'caverna']AWS40454.1 NADP-dependent oxidoreductase [Streptosporangium sp. 'caverna']